MASRDLRAELEKAPSKVPTTWDPKPGDILYGTVVRYDTGRSEWGNAQIAVIDEDGTGGLKSVWLTPTILKEWFERIKSQPGDRVAIKFLPPVEGTKTKFYDFRIQRASEVLAPEVASA